MIPVDKLERFMRQSNAIEGEVETSFVQTPAQMKWGADIGRLNPGDLAAAAHFLSLKKINAVALFSAHRKMFGHRMNDAGSYRLYNVRVGSFFPPDWKEVHKLMKDFLARFHMAQIDAWMGSIVPVQHHSSGCV